MEKITIDNTNTHLIQQFLDAANESLQTFRYYNKRTFEAIQQHIVTYVFEDEGQVVGYGHLDKENDIVWLGIAVVSNSIGKGYGKAIMKDLIEAAATNNCKTIYLTVDKNNEAAIHLYKKVGFIMIDDTNDYLKFAFHHI